jgi:hypothetical protein
MKNYIVLVEAEDFVNVDADNDEEAVKKAIAIASSSCPDWKGTVMSSDEDVENEEEHE